MKHRSIIAFTLGVLAGVLLWPDDSDSPDSGTQSVKSPKISATDGRRVPTVQNQQSSKSFAEYGSRPAGSAYGLNDREQPGRYRYGLPSGNPGIWGAGIPYTPDTGTVGNYGYHNSDPLYPNIRDRAGYRFRPLTGESDSDNARRYTGDFHTPPLGFYGNAAPRWNETPTYGQPQPRRRNYAPGYENQQPYYRPRPSDLYSAR